MNNGPGGRKAPSARWFILISSIRLFRIPVDFIQCFVFPICDLTLRFLYGGSLLLGQLGKIRIPGPNQSFQHLNSKRLLLFRQHIHHAGCFFR